jgi:hypothetical protein
MKYARCFLKGADNPMRWIDVPLPDMPHAFMNFITTIRLNGAVLPVPQFNVFLPFDQIKIALEVDASSVSMPANIIHESPPTKQ